MPEASTSGSAPAMRLMIVDWGANEHRVVWTFHHALLDGRSFPLVLREVFAFYDAAARGERSTCRCRVRTASTSSSSADSISAPPRRTGARYLAGFTAPTPLVIDRAATDDGRRPPIQGVSEQRLSL